MVGNMDLNCNRFIYKYVYIFYSGKYHLGRTKLLYKKNWISKVKSRNFDLQYSYVNISVTIMDIIFKLKRDV
jgi:hypothetical protein